NLYNPFVLELGVGLDHGGGIDGELLGELPDGGELIAWFESGGSNVILDLINDLPVNRETGVRVDLKMQVHQRVYDNTQTECVNEFLQMGDGGKIGRSWNLSRSVFGIKTVRADAHFCESGQAIR